VASAVFRVLFIAAALAVTIRVSWPQNETIWSAYETPGDVIRLGLGLIACLWIAFQIFTHPKDAHACWTWLYLGAVAIPFALIIAFAIW